MAIRIDGTNTTANPGITGADADTGLQFGTDEVKIVTGGTDAVTVDSSQRVGIGTSIPSTILSVKAAADAYVTIEPGTADGNTGLLFNNSAGTQKGVILYDTDDNYMLFSTNNTERARILSSGGITFNGDTAAANALDDYEEGTWTPSASGNATHLIQVGHYTKIGRLVTVHFVIQINAIGTGSPKQIYGLPFTPATGNAAGSCDYFEGTANQLVTLVPYVLANVSYLQMRTLTAASNGMANVNILQNNTRVDGTVTYMTTS